MLDGSSAAVTSFFATEKGHLQESLLLAVLRCAIYRLELPCGDRRTSRAFFSRWKCRGTCFYL